MRLGLNSPAHHLINWYVFTSREVSKYLYLNCTELFSQKSIRISYSSTYIEVGTETTSLKKSFFIFFTLSGGNSHEILAEVRVDKLNMKISTSSKLNVRYETYRYRKFFNDVWNPKPLINVIFNAFALKYRMLTLITTT